MDFILSHRDNVRAAKIGPKKVQKMVEYGQATSNLGQYSVEG